MDNYEKKYKEALAKAREIKSKILSSHLSTESCKAVSEYIDEIIPELRESEDERIRKEIVGVIQKHYPNTPESYRWISWLEKQKEQKPCGCVNVESEYDKGWRDGHKAGLKDAEMQKPVEWSEEDEKRMNAVIELLENTSAIHPNYSHRKLIIWLKSIRPQAKQEWGEEDEEMRKLIIAVLQVNHPNGFFKANDLGDSNMRGVPVEELVAWLKSLRPTKDCNGCSKHLEGYISGRGDAEKKLLEGYGILWTPDGELRMKPRWRPSEEQMKALQNAVALTACDKELARLYNQLKKLEDGTDSKD